MAQKLKVTEWSQEYELVNALRKADVAHRFSGKVSMDAVRVDEQGVIYFCQVRTVNVISCDTQSDEQPLPRHVRMPKMRAPEPGYYHMEGHLTVNGAMAIRDVKLQPMSG